MKRKRRGIRGAKATMIQREGGGAEKKTKEAREEKGREHWS